MKESLATFRKAVNESADLQEKVKGGTDLVELGKENGHEFSAEELKEAYEQLQEDEDGELTEFEMAAVAGGVREAGGYKNGFFGKHC
jgi:predicted ribosomally synthesized peptide with nif11-like leader